MFFVNLYVVLPFFCVDSLICCFLDVVLGRDYVLIYIKLPAYTYVGGLE